MGSPIGATMSILLAQHKAELGNKEIFQVNVVADSNSVKPSQVTELHMFFQIRDVPPPKKPEDDKTEDGKPTDAGAEGVAIAARGLFTTSLPAVNHVLHERKEILDLQDLPPSSDISDSDDDFVQTGLEWKDRSVASDAAWKTYVDKGNHFHCLMRATPEGAQKLTEGSTPVESPWTGTLSTELKTWGWHEGEVETDFDCDFERLYFKEMFTGLDLDAKPSLDEEDKPAPGHNTCFKLQHFDKSLKNPKGEELDVLQQPYVVDGITRYATGAYYNFGINSGGAIIGMDLVSPRYAVTERHNWNREAAPNELPALRYMSDIFFGYWRRITSNPKNLRYYIATHVVNDDTVKLVARALKNNKMDDLSEWPGVTFEMDSDEWAALVGSPIGASIAALLFQHKAELGLKYVPKVTVVYDSNPEKTRDRKRFRPWLHMVFHIEDVPVEK
ncbi:hypothetical protein N0V94_009305 [Neodidymelliopsis sp. IMI 364377]|nr:hypothetical protein N0V94_009305 [Neodidymelliopsis sp. IMI 364377]